MTLPPRFGVGSLLCLMGVAAVLIAIGKQTGDEEWAYTLAAAIVVGPGAFAAGCHVPSAPSGLRAGALVAFATLVHGACWSAFWLVTSMHAYDRGRLPELPEIVENLHFPPGVYAVHSVAAAVAIALVAAAVPKSKLSLAPVVIAMLCWWLALHTLLYIGCGVSLIPLIGLT